MGEIQGSCSIVVAANTEHNRPAPNRDSFHLEALRILKEFAADLVDIDDPDALLWAVATRTISQLGWVDCVIYLKDPERDVLIQKAAYGPKSIDYQSIFEPIEIPLGRGVVGKVAQSGQALRIADTSAFEDYIPDDAVRLSEIAVPILWGGDVLGVIDSEHPEADFFQEEDEWILSTIAGISATKIQNARSAKANADLAIFYKENPNPVLQLSAEHLITFINQSALHCFPDRERSLMALPDLQAALTQASDQKISSWTCTLPSPTIPGIPKNDHRQLDKTDEKRHFEFQVVALETGAFNFYGKDVTHIRNLQRQAEVAHDAKARFLSVMSHEIRTPLNAILGLTDLMQNEDIDRKDQLQHLAYMEFSGRHLLSLVNDVLDLEKLASGKAHSIQTAFNLHDLVRHISDGFSNRAQKVGLDMVVELGSDVPQLVESDVKWTTQILNNLLGNAIKYTEKGRVQLKVSCAAPVHGEHAKRHIAFEVSDTGRGIPAKDLERILQPFEQVHESANIEGTGLGLSIVHSLVQQLDGQLTVESEPNEGSTFTASIPMTLLGEDVGDPRQDVRQPANHAASDAPAHPVLLADDNELNRFVASKLLSRWGYEVVEAVNGQEALAAWRDMGPCVILMDVQMPEMDGIEATKHIRRLESERHLARSPIIALTADAEESTFKRVLAAGMDDRVVKPFDTAALQSILRRAKVGETLA